MTKYHFALFILLLTSCEQYDQSRSFCSVQGNPVYQDHKLTPKGIVLDSIQLAGSEKLYHLKGRLSVNDSTISYDLYFDRSPLTELVRPNHAILPTSFGVFGNALFDLSWVDRRKKILSIAIKWKDQRLFISDRII